MQALCFPACCGPRAIATDILLSTGSCCPDEEGVVRKVSTKAPRDRREIVRITGGHCLGRVLAWRCWQMVKYYKQRASGSCLTAGQVGGSTRNRGSNISKGSCKRGACRLGSAMRQYSYGSSLGSKTIVSGSGVPVSPPLNRAKGRPAASFTPLYSRSPPPTSSTTTTFIHHDLQNILITPQGSSSPTRRQRVSFSSQLDSRSIITCVLSSNAQRLSKLCPDTAGFISSPCALALGMF